MGELYIWIGKFNSLDDFDRYMDQQDYYQALHDGDDEPEMCGFCREIGESFDEDFLVMIYEENWLKLLSHVPADYEAFQKALAEKGISGGNALIYHDADELPLAQPENAVAVSFIGKFEEDSPTPLLTDEDSRFGFDDIIWTGKIDGSKQDFMSYFTDGRFCADVGAAASPECLHLYFAEEPGDIGALVAQIENKRLRERLMDYFKRESESNVNVLLHYAQDISIAAANSAKIQIYPRELLEQYALPKGYTAEIDSYNGLRYIASFGWV